MSQPPDLTRLRPPMLVLGHRGVISDHFGFHQNSFAAFQEAVTEADGFETDACVDADGEIFLIHEAKYVDPAKGVEYCAAEHLDAESVRLLGGRRLDQTPTKDMLKLRLRDGSPLPKLTDAITLVGGASRKLLNIELKAFEVMEPVLQRVTESLKAGKIEASSLLISSFNHQPLETVRRVAPDIQIGAIFIAEDQPSKPLFPWAEGSTGIYTSLTKAALQDPLLLRLKPDHFVMPQEILTESTAKMIADVYPHAQLAAWVFTEKNNFDVAEFLGRLERLEKTFGGGKVSAVIVDNPAEFIGVMAKR